MNENQNRKLEDLITNGYAFPVNAYLQQGWEIYKKQAGSFIGFLLITMMISFVSAIIPIIGPVANYLVLGPALMAGFYLVSNKVEKGVPHEFSEFFDGFKFVVPLMLQALVLYLIMAVIMTPTILMFFKSGIIEWYGALLNNPLDPPTSTPNVEPRLAIIMLLNMLPIMYVWVAYLWAPHFILFYGMGFWEAMEASRRLITRKWFSVFALPLAIIGLVLLVFVPIMLLTIAVPIIGALLMLAAGLAMFVVAPSYYCMIYAAFSGVMGLEDEEEEQDILHHLVE